MRRLFAAFVLVLAACAHAVRPGPGQSEEGDASYYGPGLYGRHTASGEVFRPGTFTAAHRTLPFGTCVEVTVLESGRRVQVRINDRGPSAPGRIVDLSETAAQAVGMVGKGVVRVRLTLCSTSAAPSSVDSLASLAPVSAWVGDEGCSLRSTPPR